MKKRVLVIGAVAGGATFASQLRMLDDKIEIIVFEKNATMAFANCGLPYYLGGFVKQQDHLIAATPQSFQKDRNIEVRIQHEVIAIDRDQKKITIQDHIKDTRYDETYDSLVLSPGVTPVVPQIEGLSHANCYTLRAYEDMLKIDEYVEEKPESSVCIVGAGFIGLEMAENFKARGLTVHLVQRAGHVLNMLDVELANTIEDELKEQGIHLYTDTTIDKVDQNGTTLHLANGKIIEADFLLLAVGVKPNKQLAEQSKLDIGETGGVKVNRYMQTNDPSVYAIGDVIETIDFITGSPKRVPLAWVAHRQAYVAARHIASEPIEFKGALGTAICKVFDVTGALLGHNEKSLREKNISFKTVSHESKQHAGYYPGAEKLMIKVHFSPKDGKIYGAQIVGKDGVDKRIDIIATAVSAGLTVFDLQEIEIAYSPVYSSPKDPINMIGYKAMK
ncbi:CoA-disulfide reductase [Jeotgalibacillus marinus]|uniref:CoA-disulfide reductase n=1 Tax=Jeotgalibacillus marinus TaxID=86667 RepID=A0ABV3Q2Q8_9BACL